jgi:protein-disulfide isomerase
MRQRMLDAATILLMLCALVMAGFTVRDRLNPGNGRGGAEKDKRVSNWRSLAKDGHRLVGTEQASVQILEFGDYECPACGMFHKTLKKVLPQFGNDVSVTYRHWPLTYHPMAYPGARAAECAANQQRFNEYHALLFDNHDILGKWDSVAVLAGVPNLSQFQDCIKETVPVARVERDIAVIDSIEARGTPTVIVNGVMLGHSPDSVQLTRLIRAGLRK